MNIILLISLIRPDMAPFIFTDKISNGEEIEVFNHGQSRRDFTYVQDIVQGCIHALFVNTGYVQDIYMYILHTHTHTYTYTYIYIYIYSKLFTEK